MRSPPRRGICFLCLSQKNCGSIVESREMGGTAGMVIFGLRGEIRETRVGLMPREGFPRKSAKPDDRRPKRYGLIWPPAHPRDAKQRLRARLFLRAAGFTHRLASRCLSAPDPSSFAFELPCSPAPRARLSASFPEHRASRSLPQCLPLPPLLRGVLLFTSLCHESIPPFGLSPKGLQLLKRIWRSHQIYPAVSRVIRSAFVLLPIKLQI